MTIDKKEDLPIEKPKTYARKELSNKFKFLIPSNVIQKIEYLCDKISTIEWSGVLFYKLEGSIHNIEALQITVLDLFPLDIGNGVATDYEYNEDYVRYRGQHPELLAEGVFIGHVHSHHSMATFMSGTDIGELVDSAPLHNCFVSLIVNNAGTYTVALSSVGTCKEKVSTIEQISFTDFTGTVVTFADVVGEKEVEKETVYYCYGDITKEVPPNDSLSYLFKQLENIKNLKKKATPVTKSYEQFKNIYGEEYNLPFKGYGGYEKTTPKTTKPFKDLGGLSDAEARRLAGNTSSLFKGFDSPVAKKSTEPSDEELFVNGILTLGLFSRMENNIGSFLTDIPTDGIIIYELYLPDIIHGMSFYLFNDSEKETMEALRYAKEIFGKYYYNQVAKAILKCIDLEIQDLQDAIDGTKEPLLKTTIK